MCSNSISSTVILLSPSAPATSLARQKSAVTKELPAKTTRDNLEHWYSARQINSAFQLGYELSYGKALAMATDSQSIWGGAEDAAICLMASSRSQRSLSQVWPCRTMTTGVCFGGRAKSQDRVAISLGQKGVSVQLVMLLSNRLGLPLSSRAAHHPLFPPIIARHPALWLALRWSLTCLPQNGKCFDPSYPAIALPSLDPLPSSTIFPRPHSLQSAQLLSKTPPESPFVHSQSRWPANLCK